MSESLALEKVPIPWIQMKRCRSSCIVNGDRFPPADIHKFAPPKYEAGLLEEYVHLLQLRHHEATVGDYFLRRNIPSSQSKPRHEEGAS